jgi:hypothetical protein
MKRPGRALGRAELAAAVWACLSADVPVLLWGPPGEGKTSLIEQIASLTGRHCEVLIGSSREPSDFSGLPMRIDDRVEFAVPGWARRCAEVPAAIAFLDELTTCAPAIQAPMLSVLLDRRVGDWKMPGTVGMIAAANPPEMATNGHNLTPALANRVCHLWFEALPTEWARGLATGWTLELPAEATAPTPGHDLGRWGALVAAFILRHPEHIRRLPRNLDDQCGPWASPRTWDMAARVAAAATRRGASEQVQLTLLSGCVGEAGALEFLVYASELDLPDPEDWLANPAQASVSRRPDRTLAALGGVVAAIAERPSRERWEAGWAVFARIAELGERDVAAAAAVRLAGIRQQAWPAPKAAAAFVPLLKQADLL